MILHSFKSKKLLVLAQTVLSLYKWAEVLTSCGLWGQFFRRRTLKWLRLCKGASCSDFMSVASLYLVKWAQQGRSFWRLVLTSPNLVILWGAATLPCTRRLPHPPSVQLRMLSAGLPYKSREETPVLSTWRIGKGIAFELGSYVLTARRQRTHGCQAPTLSAMQSKHTNKQKTAPLHFTRIIKAAF